MTSTLQPNPTAEKGKTDARVASSRTPEPQAQPSNHDRRRLAIGGGVLAGALAIGALVLSGGDRTVSAVTPTFDPSVAAVPSTIFPYLDTDGSGGGVEAPGAGVAAVESERPLLLDGEAFAAALADAAAATEGGQLLSGDDLARAIEQILAQASADAATEFGQSFSGDDLARAIEQIIAEAEASVG